MYGTFFLQQLYLYLLNRQKVGGAVFPLSSYAKQTLANRSVIRSSLVCEGSYLCPLPGPSALPRWLKTADPPFRGE
jgi:hypothetical protein